MNVKTVIEEIIESAIPDSVNGIHIKTDLREVQSLVYHDQRDLMLTIMPVEIECEDVAVSMRICLDAYVPTVCYKRGKSHRFRTQRPINRRETIVL